VQLIIQVAIEDLGGAIEAKYTHRTPTGNFSFNSA
jgi:hypothetical protein